MKIWKWTLEVTDVQDLQLPQDTKLLTVQVQGEMPQVWGLVPDPAAPKKARRIAIFGTGHEVPSYAGRYLGTFQLHGGTLVFHAFELE